MLLHGPPITILPSSPQGPHLWRVKGPCACHFFQSWGGSQTERLQTNRTISFSFNRTSPPKQPPRGQGGGYVPHPSIEGSSKRGWFSFACYLHSPAWSWCFLGGWGWRLEPQCWSVIISESCGDEDHIHIWRNVKEQRWRWCCRERHSFSNKAINLMLHKKKLRNRTAINSLLFCPLSDSGLCRDRLLAASTSVSVFVFFLKPHWCHHFPNIKSMTLKLWAFLPQHAGQTGNLITALQKC